MPRLFASLALILLTIILAPLAQALLQGLTAPEDESSRNSQDRELLALYRRYDPENGVTDAPLQDGLIRQCGYDPGQFEDGQGEWSPHRQGLWEAIAEVETDRRLAILQIEMSSFASAFLASCMRHSILGALCASRVAAALEGPAPEESRPAIGLNQRNACVFLDGLAARRKLPLPAR